MKKLKLEIKKQNNHLFWLTEKKQVKTPIKSFKTTKTFNKNSKN
jgi:hypothetical protein